MAEGKQNISLPDSDQHDLTVDGFDQQNITEVMHNEYSIPENDVDDPSLVGHEGVTEDLPENDVDDQNDTDIENEQTLDGEEPDQDLDGIELKQELPEGEANEHENANEDKKEAHENNLVGKVEEKKWPGWPGDSVFRMLVPGQKVGNIMGRKGEYIKKMVEETRARIKVMDGPPGSQERAVCWQFVRLQIHPCCYFKQEALKMQMPRSAWA